MGSSHVHALVDLVSRPHSMFCQGMLRSRHRLFRPQNFGKRLSRPLMGHWMCVRHRSHACSAVLGRRTPFEALSVDIDECKFVVACLLVGEGPPWRKGLTIASPARIGVSFAPGRHAVIRCGGGRSHPWCAPRWASVTAQSAPRCGAQHRVRPTPLGAQCLPDLLMSALCSVRSERP